MKREYTKRGSELIIKETARYKRLQLPRESYARVKDFFDQLSSKTKQRIMLKKIKSWQEWLKGLIEKLKTK